MSLFEGKTPAERNKTIAALVLGAIAALFLVRMFFGSSGPPRKPTGTAPASGPASATSTGISDSEGELLRNASLRPVNLDGVTPKSVPEARRNIFAYYVAPPTGTGAAVSPAVPIPPTPTPAPPPPWTLSGLTPFNVFARTGDFKLEVTGDKFTPQARIHLDGQELPTRVISPQQLSATVPASFVSSPAARQIVVRTPDGLLYSNAATLNVMPAPTPPFTYIGLLGDKRYSDKAMLKPLGNSNDLLTVQRGDVVGGRFRITSISERGVDFTDTQLNIKHTLPYIEGRASSAGGNSPPRYNAPPPPPMPQQQPADGDANKDDEP